MPPSDSFSEQHAPDLAALHPDALLLSSMVQGIQAPLGLLLRLDCLEFLSHPHRFARWIRAGQGYNLSPLLLRQSRFPPCTRPITEAVDSFFVEAGNALSDCLWMTPQLVSDGGGALTLPTADNHLGAQNPITWRMATPGQLPDLMLFLLILGRSGEQELRHGGLL